MLTEGGGGEGPADAPGIHSALDRVLVGSAGLLALSVLIVVPAGSSGTAFVNIGRLQRIEIVGGCAVLNWIVAVIVVLVGLLRCVVCC